MGEEAAMATATVAGKRKAGTASVGAMLAASAGVLVGGDGVPVGRGRVRFEFMDDEDPGPDLDDLMRQLAKDGPPVFVRLLERQAGAGRPVSCVAWWSSHPRTTWTRGSRCQACRRCPPPTCHHSFSRPTPATRSDD